MAFTSNRSLFQELQEALGPLTQAAKRRIVHAIVRSYANVDDRRIREFCGCRDYLVQDVRVHGPEAPRRRSEAAAAVLEIHFRGIDESQLELQLVPRLRRAVLSADEMKVELVVANQVRAEAYGGHPETPTPPVVDDGVETPELDARSDGALVNQD